MLTFFIFLPGFIYGYSCAAQHSTSRFSIVVSPALFVPVSVAAQGGIQIKTTNKLSVLLEAAVPVFHPDNTEYEKIDYWRTGAEFRLCVKRDSSVSKYISVQGSYLFRELHDEGQGFYYTKTQTFSYENAQIKSPVFSSAVKMGLELNASKHVYFDVFIGLGARFIFTEYVAKNALVTSTTPPRQNIFTFDDAWKFNYTLVRPHATAGVRFGVRL